MAIYPDKKDGKLTGRWRVEVQLHGLRKRGRFDTHTRAKEAESAWGKELASGETFGATARDDQGAPRTLLQLTRRAAPMLWNGSEHGLLAEGKVEKIIKWLGDVALNKLNSDYIDRTIIRLREEGRAPATVNRYLSALHAVMAWGAKPARGYIPVMPEFSWQDEDQGRIRYLTLDEEYRLVATLRALDNEEVADFVIAALDTGCRRGELLHAKADQLDCTSATGSWLRLWETKSGHPRSVPLTHRTRAILHIRLPWQITEAQLRYAFNKAKLAIGLAQDEDFVVHALRHTCATRLVALGVNLRVVQEFMGHRAIQTTLRYAHVSSETLADAAARIDQWTTSTAAGRVGDERGGVREQRCRA
jgi:integrase